MATFSTYTVVHDGMNAVYFAPGDELPEWAAGKVGDHVLDTSAEDAPETAEPEGKGADADSDVDADPVQEQAQPEAPESTETAPDFTKPAPAKRGRPRKAE